MVRVKKITFILALSCVICLVFSVTAGAVYKGFTPLNPDSTAMEPGYISFDLAESLMNANGVDPALQTTAHGGYITTTTKCSVCHSIHRATGIPDTTVSPAGPTNQQFLTSGSAACEGCHVGKGAQVSVTQVEWGLAGGPHVDAGNPGCTTCHKGGIHGSGTSSFNVMNVFMLGDVSDATLTAELPQLALRAGDIFYVPPALTGGTDYNPSGGASTTGNTWWYSGAGGPNGIGQLPAGVNSPQYAAARSVATSYVCSQAGCHVNTVMANLQWGVAYNRDITGTAATQATGHVLPALGTASGTFGGTSARTTACGPCHPGNQAGFPTDQTAAGDTSFAISRYAYGCDQCHDMVGVATNSTAWPHGNRGIKVYEWIDNGDGTQSRVESDITEGNLWMYAGNIALRSNGSLFDPANPADNAIVSTNPTITNVGANPGQLGGFADLNWRVLQGVTSGASNTIDDALTAAGTSPGFGGLTDGSCLKCHIPIDKASLDAKGAAAGAAVRSGNPGNPASASHFFRFGASTNPVTQGSQRIFLYR